MRDKELSTPWGIVILGIVILSTATWLSTGYIVYPKAKGVLTTAQTANSRSIRNEQEVKQLKRIIWLMNDESDLQIMIELGCYKCHRR